MTRRAVRLPDPQGVGVNQTAVFNLPTTGTYHGIKLIYTTATAGGANQVNMEAEITEVRLKLNGVVQRTFSARELFDINTFYGQPFETGIMSIFFSEPFRPTIQGEDGYAWGMGGLGPNPSFTMEVDIGGATTPTLRALRNWDPITQNMGLIKKWRKFTSNPSAAGVIQFNPPIREAYEAFHLDMATVTVNDVLLKINEEEDIDANKAEIDSFYGEHDFVVQADWFHVSRGAFTGRISDVWAMRNADLSFVSDFRLDLNASGAGAIPILAEVVGPRSG